MSSPSVIALTAFIAWTLLLLTLMEVIRSQLVLRGKVAANGFTPDNAGPLVAAGADLVAVIGGVFDAPDPVAAVRAYNRCFL